MFRAVISLVLFSIAGPAYAEIIGGVIVDEKEVPADGVAVVALQLPDSAYMGAAVSDSIGVFRIETKTMAPKGFVLRVEGVGYDKAIVKGKPGNDNRITVAHGGIELGEVAVVAKPRTEVSAGKFMFYPGELVNKVNDAFAVLKYAPLLDVSDFKDEIAIIGLGNAKILINGKNSIMAPQAIMQMLRASDAPRVKRVEIWVNPPVDRMEEGPIINLVLAPRTGSMGSTDLSLYYDNYLSGRWQGWYGGEWNDWQYSLDMSVHRIASKWKSHRVYTTYKVEEIAEDASPEVDFRRITESQGDSKGYMLTASAGISKDLHHDNSIGASVLLTARSQKQTSYDFSSYPTGQPSEETTQISVSAFRPEWLIGRLNYDHDLDTLGSNLRMWMTCSGTFNKADSEFFPIDVLQGFRNDYNASSVEFNGKWTKYYNDNVSTTLGISGFYDNLTNKMYYSQNGEVVGNLSLDDNLRQRQMSGDLFGGVHYDFSDLLSVNVGLRGRWFGRRIDQRVQSVSRKFDDFYILPNASLSLNVNANNMLTAGYSMTKVQPMYYDTNPIVRWSSPSHIYSGNPNLKAVTSHTINLFYVLMQKISIGGVAIIRNNVAERGTIPLEGGITYFTPIETGNAQDYKFLLSYNNSFFNYRWRVYSKAEWTVARMENNQLPHTLGNGVESDSQWNVMLSTALTLGSDRSWEIGLNGTYQSPKERTFLNVKGWVDFGLSLNKNFSWGGSISIVANNILNHKSDIWYDCEAYSTASKSLTNTRFFMVKFDFNFGKQFRMRSNSSQSDFQSR